MQYRLFPLKQISVVIFVIIFFPWNSFAAGTQVRIVQRDVTELISQYNISVSPAHLRAITTDINMSHYGFLFDDGKNVKVFRDGEKVYEGQHGACTVNPYLFWMTDDGHLVHASDCLSLYFDDHRISSNNKVLKLGKESSVYKNGRLLYPEGESIISYDSVTQQSVKLFDHPGERILFMRVKGDQIVYTAIKVSLTDLTIAIYSNGKRISLFPVFNFANFLISKSGDAYYFSERGSRYTLYRNKSKYFTARGKSGFLFEDDDGNIWHASFIEGKKPNDVHIFLYKNRRKKNFLPAYVANVEGFMAFSKGEFALRAMRRERTDGYSLLKNGKFIGDVFSFDPNYKDYNGLFFADNGKVYMRNYQEGRWLAFEDGQPILTNVFQNVWLVHKDLSGDVVVYGTK